MFKGLIPKNSKVSLYVEKNGHTPQKEIVRRFPINGGEVCPRVFFTMDSASLATIMSGLDMREEVSRSPYIKFFSKLLSGHSLTRKASLNALAAVLDYAANLIVGFLITPFLVTGLGDYYYGAWQILKNMVGYMGPVSGRPTQALKIILAKEQASSDFDLKRSYVGSALVVFALFLPFIGVAGGLLTWFVPYWIKTPAQFVWSVRIACGILVVNLIMYTLVALPRSVLEGANKGYKRMGLSALLVFVGGGLTGMALYFETGIIGVASAAVASTVILGLLFIAVVRTYEPWFGFAKPSKETVNKFLGLSWWFIAWNMINNLMMASDVVVLGLLNSVESVTNYALCKYVPETSITIVSIMVFGIVPGLGGIIGSGDLVRAAKVRGEIMTFTWLVVTVLGTGVLLWNRTFIHLWVGEEHFLGGLPLLLIVLNIVQVVFIFNDAHIIDLTLCLRSKVILGAVSVVISLLAASILVYFFKMGVIGVIIGIMIGRMILSIQYPILISRELKIDLFSQIKATFRPALFTAVLFLAAFVLEGALPTGGWHSLSGWIAFSFWVGITFCVVLVLAFLGGLSKKQQEQVLYRVVLSISTKK